MQKSSAWRCVALGARWCPGQCPGLRARTQLQVPDSAPHPLCGLWPVPLVLSFSSKFSKAQVFIYNLWKCW